MSWFTYFTFIRFSFVSKNDLRLPLQPNHIALDNLLPSIFHSPMFTLIPYLLTDLPWRILCRHENSHACACLYTAFHTSSLIKTCIYLKILNTEQVRREWLTDVLFSVCSHIIFHRYTDNILLLLLLWRCGIYIEILFDFKRIY